MLTLSLNNCNQTKRPQSIVHFDIDLSVKVQIIHDYITRVVNFVKLDCIIRF